VQPEPDGEGGWARDQQGQERVDAPADVQRVGQVGAQHQELAVRHVQHPHQPVLEIEAEGHQGIDAARGEPPDHHVDQ
jgi:hypothetical protein